MKTPDIAEPVITARAQLSSSSVAYSRDPLAHPIYAFKRERQAVKSN